MPPPSSPQLPPARGHRLPLVLLTHPIELALAAGTVLSGIRGVLGSVTPSLLTLPTVPLGLYLLLSTLGGVGVIVGAVQATGIDRDIRRVAFGLSVERASLILIAVSYVAVAALIVYNVHLAGTTVATTYVLLAAGCILRAVAIRRAARAVLTTLRLANLEGGGNE